MPTAPVPLPEGYHSVNPYIVVDGAERLIGFLVAVFGAVEQRRVPRADQPWGDRACGVADPFGNRWWVATHLRDVT